MAEASIIGSFVDDHSVLHIVASVTDDSDNSIGSTWAKVEVILQMLGCADQWLLGEQESVDFVIHTVGMIVIRCTHSLLSHLALIHVSWTLVVVTEWDRGGNDRKYIQTVHLLVSSVWSDVFFERCDRKRHLLKWSNPLSTANHEVLDRSDKASYLRGHEDSWEVVILFSLIFGRFVRNGLGCGTGC